MQELNDEQFLYVAQYTNQSSLSRQDRVYIVNRLKTLGYTIMWGCCGTNMLRRDMYERQSSIPKNE